MENELSCWRFAPEKFFLAVKLVIFRITREELEKIIIAVITFLIISTCFFIEGTQYDLYVHGKLFNKSSTLIALAKDLIINYCFLSLSQFGEKSNKEHFYKF